MNREEAAELAKRADESDALARFRGEFLFPEAPGGEAALYFAGNSLGLQPKRAREYVLAELDDWARLGVEGHFAARHPWLPYHENLTAAAARLVGARPLEVVVMNTLTVNLHLMMISFYRPTAARYRILIEAGAFPSDRYAVDSQARLHGFDPSVAIVELAPRAGEETLRDDDILAAIAREGGALALVMLGNVNYLTGQAFDMAAITRAAHAVGARAGFDLAHGAGNLEVALHESGADFAVWCSYKYLNGGPGTLGGCFVHERHARDASLPRLQGWWGHDKATRFKMGPRFDAIEGAEGWQLSNPPILQLAALRASFDLFDAATMPALRAKSLALTGYLERLLDAWLKDEIEIVTPREPARRGAQLSLRVLRGGSRALVARLAERGVICDHREPDILRVAPAPLYTRFDDVRRLCEILREEVGK